MLAFRSAVLLALLATSCAGCTPPGAAGDGEGDGEGEGEGEGVGEGDLCASGGEAVAACAPPLECSAPNEASTDFACAQPSDEGGSCHFGEPPPPDDGCIEGLACGCRELFCFDSGECVPQRGDGASCGDDGDCDDGRCASTFEVDRSVCHACGCEDDEICVLACDTFCTPPQVPRDRACAARVYKEPCGAFSLPCAGDLECFEVHCYDRDLGCDAGDSICRAPRAVGFPCTDASECDSGVCVAVSTYSAGASLCAGDGCAEGCGAGTVCAARGECGDNCEAPGQDDEDCANSSSDACSITDRACATGLECMVRSRFATDRFNARCTTPGDVGARCDSEASAANSDGCLDGLTCSASTSTCG